MKKLLILLILFLMVLPLFSQDWIKYYGNGQQAVSWYCMEQYDKGFILLGNINNYKYGWIVKTDINGNELWEIKIGDGVHNTTPVVIEQTKDHGFILGGSTNIYNPSKNDPLIIKLNSCGEMEWCKVLIFDSSSDVGMNVKQASDGGFVLLAELYGNDPNDRLHLFKFDSGGEFFWHKIYNRDSLVFGEIARSLNVDSTNILITAFCYYPNWMKPYYIQTDTSGNETWRLSYSQHTGLGYVGDAWATIRDKHGNYYSAGRRESSPEIIKFSSDGNEMMNVDLFPTAQSGGSRSIVLMNDTSCILGAGWSINGIINYLGMIRTDTLGEIKNIKYFPDPDHSGINWTTNTSDNKILTIGNSYIGSNSRMTLYKLNSNLEYDSIYTHPFTYDSLCPSTIVSHTITPNCGVLVSANEHLTNPEATTLKVFPNPANQKVTVEFPKYLVVKTGTSGFGSTTVYHHWKSTMLEVYDLSGKKVFEKEIIRKETSGEIDVSQWNRGMYNFVLRYNKQKVAGEKVIIR